jgi:class 3 adenylate cyclase/tetratricopeptide (TPR) repeat protein
VLTCPTCGQENPDGFKFCGACGSLLAAPEPGEEERKIVTAVFTDIVGSTARAETLDPEDVRAMLAPYYTRVRRELERFGGTVEKFIGDAVVAVFGAPVAHEDDPERAVRAALAIQTAVAALNAEQEWLDLHIRTAVNTGEALVVVGASAVEGEGMAAGDVMNTAARLQGAAPVDGIAVGESTFRATAHLFEYAEAEPIVAKGKAEPLPVWVLQGEKVAPKRPQPWRRLVGREAEIAQLSTVWQRAADGTPQLVTILGAPGIGKSRLVIELSQLVPSDVAMPWGRCLPYGEGITYWPVTEIIKDLAGILNDDDVPAMSRRLGALLESLPTENRDELRTIAAALSNLLGAATTPEGTYLVQQIGQAELHWGIRRFLELHANQRPLILVFEDLHWAEPTLLELIRSLIECTGPMLVVGTARPELAEEEPDFATPFERRHAVHLEPLGADASLALLDDLVGASARDASRFALLLEKAGGNPLFLEETVRMLADADLLAADADIASLRVPESLQALIGSRLDALARGDKRVAQQASVVGNVFWQGAVAHVAKSADGLEDSLVALERRDLIHHRADSTIVGDREYGFKHILIHDVAYERLPKGRRAELHVRFVDWLRELGFAEDEFVEIEAYHLEQACLHALAVARAPIEPPIVEAAQALSRAADKAERREGMRESARFCARALELVGDDYPETAIELQLRNARALAFLGNIDLARERLADVAERAPSLGRLDLRCSALVGLAGLDHRQGQATDARSRLAEAETLAASAGDRRLPIRTAFALAAVGGDFGGVFEEAREHLRRGISIAEEIDDRALRVEGHLRLAFLLFNAGGLAEAQEEVERCLQLAAELGSRRDEARGLFLLAFIRFEWGDVEESQRHALEAVDALERTGEPYFQVQNFGVLAECALARGDAELAEERLRPALPLAIEEGGWLLIAIYRLLAQALVGQGRVEDAAELVEFAGRNVPEGYAYARGLLMLARATVATARRARDEAIGLYEKALGDLEEARLPLDVCRTRVAFARALAAFGDDEAARRQLEEAHASFRRLGAEGVATRLERELTALAGGAG